MQKEGALQLTSLGATGTSIYLLSYKEPDFEPVCISRGGRAGPGGVPAIFEGQNQGVANTGGMGGETSEPLLKTRPGSKSSPARHTGVPVEFLLTRAERRHCSAGGPTSSVDRRYF